MTKGSSVCRKCNIKIEHVLISLSQEERKLCDTSSYKCVAAPMFKRLTEKIFSLIHV